MAWWREFGRHTKPQIHIWEDKGRVVGLLPLARVRQFGVGAVIRFLNGEEVAPDGLDVLVEPAYSTQLEEALSGFILDLSTSDELIQLDNVASDGLLAGVWTGLLSPARPGLAVRPWLRQPQAKLPHDFDVYLASRGSQLRYNFRRRSRQLAKKCGAFVHVSSADTEKTAREQFDIVWRLHAESFGRKHERDCFTSERVRRFHDAVVTELGPSGLVRFISLRNDNGTLASLYAFVRTGTMYYYQLGFKPEVRSLSPGLVTIGAAIRAAIEDGCAKFDFLRGEEPYKEMWSNGLGETVRLEAGIDRPGYRFRRAARKWAGRIRRLPRALKGPRTA